MTQFLTIFITNFILFFITVMIAFQKNNTKKEDIKFFVGKLLLIDFIASIGFAVCLLLIEEVQLLSATFVVLGMAMIEFNVLIPILLSKNRFESVSINIMIAPLIIKNIIMDTIILISVLNY